MEHLFCATDYDHCLGSTLRLSHLLLLVPSFLVMDTRDPHGILDILINLGILIQQDSQALGSLFPLPSGRHLHPGIHRLWVFPWLNQVMGPVYSKRGKLTAALPI